MTTFNRVLINELTDGMELDQVLLVRQLERRPRRDGGDYLRLLLGDRTGAVPTMVWEGLEQAEAVARAGEPVHVRGRYSVHPRFGPQINLRGLDAAVPGSFSPGDLLAGPLREAGQMERDLRELILTVQDPHLRRLLERVLGERSQMWPGYRMAPAAKYYHQAYPHGLLEHCLGVAQAVSATSATFPGIDRDVAVTGALLHDIGKLEAYTEDARGHRPHRPRSPAWGDRARLLPHPPRDRGDRGLPRAARVGGAAHHPLPPRLARARQPGRAMHAGGDAGAHDRQPRRAAGQLRSLGEGAGPRPPLVGVRSRAWRCRLLPQRRELESEALEAA